MKILSVVGARPNFMKIAPLLREMRKHPELETILVHTGQHYDTDMSDVFFKDLEISAPDVHLGVGSGTHAVQTGRIMAEFEGVLKQHAPDLVVLVGDVNSTLACSVVASKALVPVAHVEAGLRSFDRTMPEEINRVVTDALSSLLFTTSRDADENLKREGVSEHKIHFVGNVMIDSLVRCLEMVKGSRIRESLDLNGDYALLTLHRPGNVDRAEPLRRILDALATVAARVPIVFPIHPRTRRSLQDLGLNIDIPGLRTVDPIGYRDFLHLEQHATLVLTDSGGIQEETTVLGVPCLTLRPNTERPVTITEGTNLLVGNDPQRIVSAAEAILDGKVKPFRTPELWDGKAAERIVNILRRSHQQVPA